MPLDIDQSEAERHLDILNLDRYELRCLRADGQKGIRYIYSSDRDALAGLAANISDAGFEGVDYNAYVTVNELHPSFAAREAPEMVWAGTGATTQDGDIAWIRNLVADVDPDKPEGVKGPASDAERAAVRRALDKIKLIAAEHDLPELAYVDSGNGGYAIGRTDLPNNVESIALVKAWLRAWDKLLGREGCHVDQSTFNPARIFRLAGTANRKGVESPDRPYRVAKVLSAPDKMVVITRDQLVAFVESVLGAGCLQVEQPEPQPEPQDDGYYSQRVELLETALQRAKITYVKKIKDTCTAFDLSHCPFKAEGDTDGGPGFIVRQDGSYGFSCLHEKCKDKTFDAAARKLKLDLATIAGDLASAEMFGQTKRSHTDPLLLAQRHIAKTSRGGIPTLAFYWGELHQYAPAGWQRITNAEIEPAVRATIQGCVDEHARITSKYTGSPVKPTPVDVRLVRDTLAAIKSISQHDIPRQAQAPFWLSGQGDWQPDDIIVCRNGFLNARHYVNGQDDYFRPLSPRLYYLCAADVDFDPLASEPPRWLKFLASLKQTDEWIASLRQVMGYILWGGLDLQKLFQLIGPTRAGKGIIAGVLRDLHGGDQCVAALELADAGEKFALECALDKRLVIIPEGSMPQHGLGKVTSRLKAITGGDVILVNRKSIKNVSVQLRCKILLLTNDFLVLPDSSGAMATRMFPLRMTESFKGAEDFGLASALREEYPGILNWALDGIRSLVASQGQFIVPQSTAEDLEQLHADSAPLKQFVDDCCELNATKCCHSLSLYEIYCRWHVKHSDGEPLATNAFTAELRKTAYTIGKARLNKPSETRCKNRTVTPTQFDKLGARASIYLGVTPKPEFCGVVKAAA